MSDPMREGAIALIKQQLDTAERMVRIDARISKLPGVQEKSRARLRERVAQWSKEAMVWQWALKELSPAGTVEA